jgi:catechol 2,3-dioxygenase-like lactoylglutathione lyase family enzyme
MRAALTFLLGLGLGAVVTTVGAQDRRLPGVVGINHIAIVTANYDAMRAFYVDTMGFPEVFTSRSAAGEPTLTYLQASRATFIELFPANATRQPGFQHVGLHVEDVNATAARLRERGMTVGTPRQGGTGSIIVTVTDPDGTRIELSELGPESRARQATEAWRP